MSGHNTVTFATAINAASGAPSEIVLLPAGAVQGRDGRAFVNDRPDDVIAVFAAGGADLPVDLEHATELKAPKGEPAPAHGWIKRLINRDGAICAQIEWTEAGAQLVAGKAYRYVSPAFLHQRDNGRVMRLLSVGLTNRPNLHIPALNSTQETSMDRAAIAAALGIATSATDADVVTAINSLKTKADTPDPSRFVPKADLDQALNRATTAEQKLADMAKTASEQRAAALIDQAVKDGKIAPVSKDHYLALCRAEGGFAQVEALLKTLPKIAGETGLDQRRADDPPLDTSDPIALASEAQAYREAQAKLGINLSIADAVAAVKETRK